MIPAGPYHHGDLESALLAAATRIIAEQGIAALSLRALGKAAGVSRAAPYHYFPDKQALLFRIGEQGFAALAAATEGAGAHHADPVARGRAGLHAYVAFAQANPQLFRLMFAGVLPRRLTEALSSDLQEDFSSAAAAQAFRGLLDGVAALPDSRGLSSDALILRTNVIWAAVHGVAMLAIDENLKLAGADMVLDALLDRLVGVPPA